MSKYLSYSELREGDESSLSLEERLSKYPHLCRRMESLLGIIENDDGSCQTADEAERRAIEEVRKLGQEVLQGWLGHQSDIKEAESSQKADLIRDGKKTVLVQYLWCHWDRRTCFPGRTARKKTETLECLDWRSVPGLFKASAASDGGFWCRCLLCSSEPVGAQANYLIDFYHLSDNLGAACQAAFEDGSAALKKQKQTMKKGGAANVLEQFKSRQESESIPNEKAPIRALVRYMKNRPGQFEYKTAIDQQLPIGSGKIESAHRSLIQKRLKLPGAWWKKQHADQMIQLRVARANGKWDCYWQQLQRA